MGCISLIIALAFLLIYWITAWSVFKTLATVCAVVAVVLMTATLIFAVFHKGE